ncbi:MOSC domain-containing protein [Terrimesophilobacter mesophilus]|uniref:MOSC domain-containing protein n=1 Tax=Terrimesophilobacter mesophilus TaxID=433647 RepID=A0A4R8VFT4_9MICO|nr:MOSC domain-containing protein [Terrimesophilobacter mesophilus]
MRVTRLRTYPVKSFAGNDVETAVVEPWGLAGDRRWALVDVTGRNVTARMVHELLGLRAEPVDDSTIRLSDRGGGSLMVSVPVGRATVAVGFSGLDQATPADDTASAWISERIGMVLRLVWQPDPTLRPIAEKHGGRPGESLSLADDGPLLLVTAASMHQLNDWVAAEQALPDLPDLDPGDLSGDANPEVRPLDIVRFRPNVIVEGGEPFAEDGWETVRIGDVEFRKTVLCDRCVMTTIEPTTLEGGKEPIRTLARHRRWDGKTWFGIRLAPVGVLPRSGVSIAVDDRVEVLS